MQKHAHVWGLDTLVPNPKKKNKVIFLKYEPSNFFSKCTYWFSISLCVAVHLVPTAYVKENSKDIWCEEEVAEGSQYDDLADPRPQPE